MGALLTDDVGPCVRVISWGPWHLLAGRIDCLATAVLGSLTVRCGFFYL